MQRHFSDWLRGPLLIVWVGSLWVVGYLVVPQLFVLLPDRVMAGRVAGELLRMAAWVGLVLAPPVLFSLWPRGPGRGWRQRFPLVLLVLLIVAGHVVSLALLQPEMLALKAAVAPLDVMQSPLREQFVRWHGAASGVYLLQSLVALLVVVRYGGASRI
ncbi:DUF4149 domain-containing protein [Dechloromonas sp. ZY10]|uniref:DUF4149 domain-containing protein n=1 Tax=Dechloromonas aquae TaxID=2664436 RepID=UPI003527B5B9